MQLGKREKLFVQLAAFAVTAFCLLQFAVFPMAADRKRLKKSIVTKEKGLEKMLQFSREYMVLKQQSHTAENVIRRRAPGFTLFSFLEKAAGKAGVKRHIKYMKPSSSKGEGGWKETMVEMKLDKISLKRLMDYLYLIELSGKAIQIKRCAVTENKGLKGSLDVVLQVITFEPP
jgi:general secretion pathway protein M